MQTLVYSVVNVRSARRWQHIRIRLNVVCDVVCSVVFPLDEVVVLKQEESQYKKTYIYIYLQIKHGEEELEVRVEKYVVLSSKEA